MKQTPAAASTTAIEPNPWIVSPRWDLFWLTLSALLVAVPPLAHSYWKVGSTGVDLLVTAMIGGPHMYATFLRTVLEPKFREQVHPAWLIADARNEALDESPRLEEEALPQHGGSSGGDRVPEPCSGRGKGALRGDRLEPCGGGRDRGTVAVEDRFKDLTCGLGLDALLEPLGVGVVGVAGIHNVDVVLVASSRHGHVELLP